MYVVNALTKMGPRPAHSKRSTLRAAIAAALEMKSWGHWHITITDTYVGKALPLDWWQNAVAEATVE
jgi:hypothetical protein